MRSATKIAIGFMNTFMAIRAQALGHHIKQVGLASLQNSSNNKANTGPLANRIHSQISEVKILGLAVTKRLRTQI